MLWLAALCGLQILGDATARSTQAPCISTDGACSLVGAPGSIQVGGLQLPPPATAAGMCLYGSITFVLMVLSFVVEQWSSGLSSFDQEPLAPVENEVQPTRKVVLRVRPGRLAVPPPPPPWPPPVDCSPRSPSVTRRPGAGARLGPPPGPPRAPEQPPLGKGPRMVLQEAMYASAYRSERAYGHGSSAGAAF
mmetsp:Transcript_14006/g.31014  ORF Transcript_14006/g.31014 Transcript_14006/m.31014 type:complete len:192 (-) Transcript_14006:581-1156(-)